MWTLFCFHFLLENLYLFLKWKKIILKKFKWKRNNYINTLFDYLYTLTVLFLLFVWLFIPDPFYLSICLQPRMRQSIRYIHRSVRSNLWLNSKRKKNIEKIYKNLHSISRKKTRIYISNSCTYNWSRFESLQSIRCTWWTPCFCRAPF